MDGDGTVDRLHVRTRARGRAALRTVAVAALACVGMFVTLACVIALNFELTGFGRQADTPLRVPYVASLVVGAVAGVLVPAGAAFVWLGPAARTVTAVVGSAVLLLLLVFLGLRVY